MDRTIHSEQMGPDQHIVTYPMYPAGPTCSTGGQRSPLDKFMQWIVNYAVESDLCNGYENIQYQGPISRSMQLNYIPVTAIYRPIYF